jgi:putative toxin-antitoxin system antitoxin component (TIGR02293 family)
MIEASKVAEILGGSKVFRQSGVSEMQFFDQVNQGLPVRALESLLDAHLLSKEEAARLIVSPRRLARRKKPTRLTTEESDRLARVARLISYTIAVFDDEQKAAQWLRRPNRALHQKTPIELLGTDSGARLVEAGLARIEHGVYS